MDEQYKPQELYIGQKLTARRIINEEVVARFAEATGDFNPIHLSDDAAARSIFKKRVAHGMLGACMMIAVSVSELKQYGGIHLGYDIRFLKPIYVGEEIVIELEVIELSEDKRRGTIKGTCYNSQMQAAIVGESYIIPAPV